MDNNLVHRQFATTTVLVWINTSRCWHLDCWMYVSAEGVLYLLAETRRGGRELIGSQWFALVKDETFGVFQLVACGEPATRIGEIALNSPPALRVLGTQGADVFWRLIAPLANLWPRGEYRRRSIAFHMIRPIGVDDPCEGVRNFYGATGRAARDAEFSRRSKGG